MNKVEFGRRLRDARLGAGLTQVGLEEVSGIESTALSHFECGRRFPSFENLVRLADALETTTDWLMGRNP